MSFFFNDTATTEIYTLSLHDALPICVRAMSRRDAALVVAACALPRLVVLLVERGDILAEFTEKRDRKSTRLNSSHANISYAVFCLQNNDRLRHALLFDSPIPLDILCS